MNKLEQLRRKYPDVELYHGFEDDANTPDYGFVFCCACEVYGDCPDYGDDPDEFYHEVVNDELLADVDDLLRCHECGGCRGW